MLQRKLDAIEQRMGDIVGVHDQAYVMYRARLEAHDICNELRAGRRFDLLANARDIFSAALADVYKAN